MDATTQPADTTAKERARAAVEAARPDLLALSHRIHAHPELGYEEEHASRWLAEILAEAGLDVTAGICDLPTAFRAVAGSGPLHLAVCAEYDCLPDIGHACGHNVIAAAAVGAALAVAPLADDLGITLSILGTPAEEGGGGKILMLDRGAFAGVHAAMMVHPTPREVLRPTVTAVAHFDVCYRGRESHAAAAPELGINAADAFVVAQGAIGLLRQHLRPTDQVHGIVTHGGEAANVVPSHTRGRWMVRARDLDELVDTRARVERCFEAGALATGCELETTPVSPDYAHMVHHDPLVSLYRANAEALGRGFPDDARITFSTDMGNVSLAIPSIHPTLAIETGGAVNHQPEFAAACVNASADRAVVDGAVAMAWTAIDVATGPERAALGASG
jgi:amidohydrolase